MKKNCSIKLPFCNRQLPFHCCKFRKAYFVSAFFFAGANYLFADANREKPILRRHFLAKAKKIELQGLEMNIRMKEKCKKR